MQNTHAQDIWRHKNDKEGGEQIFLVLNPWNVDALTEVEKETGRKVYTILQLRLHPSIAGP